MKRNNKERKNERKKQRISGTRIISLLSPLSMKCCLLVAALLPMRRIQTPKCAYMLVNGLQEMIKCHDTICNVWKSVCTKENLLSSTGRLCI